MSFNSPLAKVTPSGGVPPYSVAWTGGNSDISINAPSNASSSFHLHNPTPSGGHAAFDASITATYTVTDSHSPPNTHTGTVDVYMQSGGLLP